MSASSTDNVIVAKEALALALGDNWETYRLNMTHWFRNRWTKEEFDAASREILTADKIHLHNQLLLALINRIEAVTVLRPISSMRKRKSSSSNVSDLFNTGHCFMGVNQTAQLPVETNCAQHKFLPDAGFIMGRLLLGAWEIGLTSVDDNVAEYVAMAVRQMLKNLIAGIIKSRKHYKTSGDGNFYYDVGAQLRDPSLRNTVTRQKLDDAPLELDKEQQRHQLDNDILALSACEQVLPNERIVITLRDCQDALRDRNLIGSHAIYSINMERLNMMMH
ncbi:Ada1-2 [Drosophila busckii]|uniref:Ada1-2 n=1 Tax=Drosophila busckii TaxID=30019 RepID=A0A0M4EX40_DROBS|nr:transcriptional adapter 1 [Drosophila busckii]ALC42800.1 Ada1-2 [Drosophila busckii]